ncbi:MAG: sulfatase-like hydrolase/transferase, partial [Lentisphaeria bacterium]|nr:sulfatase-like hydrolase/transferase [Lentisphaeria bacterium]
NRGYHETHFVFPGDLAAPYSGQMFSYHDGDELVTGHSTELLCERAAEFVDRAPLDQPWFCYVALHSPHDPRVCPEPWMSMYDHMLPPLPENFLPEHPFDNGDMMIRDERLAGFPRRQQEVIRHRADYYAMISHHDYWIGKVLATLKRRGFEDDTLVVFTSDHGLACGCHGLMGKENLYEHSARVPLLLAGPGIPRGERHDLTCLCGHYDFIPTLCNLLELPVPETVEGVSYHEVVLGQRDTVRETICAAYRQCMRMARDERYKIIHYPHLGRTQLFDLLEDPQETNDLLASWRRDAEGRICPPPATPERPVPPPDPEPKQGGFNNPLYTPPISRAEADAIVARLLATLRDWQEENQDPIRC